MATRSSSEGYSKRVNVEEEALVEPKSPSTVRLVLLQDVRLTVYGPQTGNKYFFDRAGFELDVDTTDAPGLLAKQTGKACCGGSKPSNYFKTVD